MLHISEVSNGTVVTGNTDDVTDKPSYGWIFSTVTAFGLLLFLAISFALYHRRLMIRRRKEKEYNSFFRFLRPDLQKSDTKRTRARSILTNTHNVGSSSVNTKAEYYNEAFEDEEELINYTEDTGNETKISYAEWVEKREDVAVEKQMEDRDIYLRSVQARRKVFLADVQSEKMFRDSGELNVADVMPDKSIFKDYIADERGERFAERNVKAKAGHGNTKTSTPESEKKFISQMQFEDNEDFDQPRRQIIAHKLPLVRPLIDITSPTEGKLKKETALEPIKTTKKKRNLLSHAYKKHAISLDVDNRDTPVFYSKQRRNSEPELFLYNKQTADPQDARLYDNQNKILFNPYHTDIEMPVHKNQKRLSCTAEDEQEVDVFKHEKVYTRF
ncbi:uncharacterized protein LOC123539224 [Mercenaria mercenaria]|uniref:uncharacterized protein LOC123539224 n=1 Tax=Mercenaria mercenaria TaxID=6596 RepID=UPI00234E89A8|nr:uncharacterized protein LOC123539224 [Mercenaria mercenaria]